MPSCFIVVVERLGCSIERYRFVVLMRGEEIVSVV